MKVLITVLSLVCLVIVPAQAWQFELLASFPAPATGAYDVTGTNLSDGRFVFWNGNAVYFQQRLKADSFLQVASGYAGDPGFIALSPDGSYLVLGEGYGGNLYKLDVDQPENYTESAVLLNISHYDGIFLTQNLLLLDISRADWSGTDLVVVDLSDTKSTDVEPVAIVIKNTIASAEKDVIVEKPLFSYSASLAHDPIADIVYAFDGNAQELRYFYRQALVDAYLAGSTLDWGTDGVLIGAPGDFFTAGVGSVMSDGNLLIGGAMGFFEPGGIQVVDPMLNDPSQAYVVTVLDPAGNQGFYGVIYNPVTDTIIAIADGVAYITRGALQPLPAAGAIVLIITLGCLIWLGRNYIRQQDSNKNAL